jgi:signal transduction histidine kinase
MIGLKRALWGIGLAGLVIGGLTIYLVAASDHEPSKVPTMILGPFVGWSFIGVGLYAWWRRPDNRVGALMTAVGFAFAAGALFEANEPLLYTIGVLVSSVYAAVIVHMLLAFPTGRLDGRRPRALVAAAYVVVLAIPLGVSLFREGCDCGVDNAPDNLLFIARHDTVADVIDIVGNVLAVALTVAVAVILFRRWRLASPVQRRSLGPVLWTGALFTLGLALSSAGDILGGHNGANAVNGPGFVCFILLPYSFLVGLLRSRYSRAGAVGQLVLRLQGESSLRDALAEALGDRSLRLLYRRPGRDVWVDHDGQPVALPEAGVTPIERDGEAVGAIVHDPALDEEPELLQTAAGAAALALDNERLAAELHARVDELEESRRRGIVAGMAERRRLERDLHDGAQQRLVALSLQLGLARGQVDRDPEAAGRMLDAAREELRQALEELRELARGIHPAVLTDRGLDAALVSLADRSPLPVALDETPAERLPAAVEAAAYFVVAESLTNVARYAEAHEAHVSVSRHNGAAVVEVRDDGVGGADAAGGTGLRGLADRLAALDGSLEVLSPPGGGTLVRATIPCAS